MHKHRFYAFHRVLSSALIGASCALAVAGPARAQAIVTAVNGDPITTFDLDEHAKLLRISRKSATRQDALEDVIADRIKYDEAKRWGLDASDSDMQAALARVSAESKMQPQAWVDAATKAHIAPDAVRAHLRSVAAWNNYVRARNKTLGVSEEEVSARLAKQGGDLKITDYTLNQVVFVLPVNASAAVVETRLKEAQGLRNRFNDCATGFQLARALPEVVVKETMTRESESFSAAFKKVLADTPRGRLTPPERSPSGVEMIAVCDKNDESDQTSLREHVQKDVLLDKLAAVSQQMYKDLRSTAVISKN